MRVHGHARIAVLARRSRNGVSTSLRQRFAIVVPTPLAKPPNDEHNSTQLRIKGETYGR
jgi:hypothetical protein